MDQPTWRDLAALTLYGLALAAVAYIIVMVIGWIPS